jgi:hypothetical protein
MAFPYTNLTEVSVISLADKQLPRTRKEGSVRLIVGAASEVNSQRRYRNYVVI